MENSRPTEKPLAASVGLIFTIVFGLILFVTTYFMRMVGGYVGHLSSVVTAYLTVAAIVFAVLVLKKKTGLVVVLLVVAHTLVSATGVTLAQMTSGPGIEHVAYWDFETCELIEKLQRRQWVYNAGTNCGEVLASEALRTNNPILCERVGEYGRSYREQCFIAFAERNHSEPDFGGFCSPEILGPYSEHCYFAVASEYGRLDLCAKAGTYRDECVRIAEYVTRAGN